MCIQNDRTRRHELRGVRHSVHSVRQMLVVQAVGTAQTPLLPGCETLGRRSPRTLIFPTRVVQEEG